MSVLIFLAIAAVSVAGGFLIAFIWAAKSGQFDDTTTPAIRILFENNSSKKDDKPHKKA
jgi:cbb3-type cytochrome oxidase maturation protein